ncbi:Protein DMP6 [Hirschfeldia incana]|nr:Protein DMP6 [Hirschfeldia incana]
MEIKADEEAGINDARRLIEEEKAHRIIEGERVRCMIQEEEKVPLLEGEKFLIQTREFPAIERNTWIQKAIAQTFQTTSHLANLLPTGTVLAYQILSPIFTNAGSCSFASRFMTATLVFICGFSCFMLSFTDSYKDLNGNSCYGFATFNGFWIIDGSATLPPERASTYKLRFIDFAHAIMSFLVFGAVVMFDQNAVKCFIPEPSAEEAEILTALPVGIGVFCSMLFATFPTTRHGIGFSISDK